VGRPRKYVGRVAERWRCQRVSMGASIVPTAGCDCARCHRRGMTDGTPGTRWSTADRRIRTGMNARCRPFCPVGLGASGYGQGRRCLGLVPDVAVVVGAEGVQQVVDGPSQDRSSSWDHTVSSTPSPKTRCPNRARVRCAWALTRRRLEDLPERRAGRRRGRSNRPMPRGNQPRSPTR
jgi:hypothetical protein